MQNWRNVNFMFFLNWKKDIEINFKDSKLEPRMGSSTNFCWKIAKDCPLNSLICRHRILIILAEIFNFLLKTPTFESKIRASSLPKRQDRVYTFPPCSIYFFSIITIRFKIIKINISNYKILILVFLKSLFRVYTPTKCTETQ